MPQKSSLNVEVIEDVEVNKDLDYIKELEAEIDGLNAQIATLQKQLQRSPVVKEVDIDYKIKYHQLLKTFQTTLEEFLPF